MHKWNIIPYTNELHSNHKLFFQKYREKSSPRVLQAKKKNPESYGTFKKMYKLFLKTRFLNFSKVRMYQCRGEVLWDPYRNKGKSRMGVCVPTPAKFACGYYHKYFLDVCVFVCILFSRVFHDFYVFFHCKGWGNALGGINLGENKVFSSYSLRISNKYKCNK